VTVTHIEDLVVLLDDDGTPRGHAPRTSVHGPDTPLHLAFSCYVLDDDGHVLMTRRALSKRTWPGVWTNSFCGHPRPREDAEEAVARRGREELGIEIEDLQLMLPRFRYRAVDASGVVENELCPVWFATTRSAPMPDPAEVMDRAWVDVTDLGRAVAATPWAFSPWMVLQVEELARLVGPGVAHDAPVLGQVM